MFLGSIAQTLIGATSYRSRMSSVSRISTCASDLLGTKAINLELNDSNVFYKNGDTLVSALQESLTKSVQAEILPVKERRRGRF